MQSSRRNNLNSYSVLMNSSELYSFRRFKTHVICSNDNSHEYIGFLSECFYVMLTYYEQFTCILGQRSYAWKVLHGGLPTVISCYSGATFCLQHWDYINQSYSDALVLPTLMYGCSAKVYQVGYIYIYII